MLSRAIAFPLLLSTFAPRQDPDLLPEDRALSATVAEALGVACRPAGVAEMPGVAISEKIAALSAVGAMEAFAGARALHVSFRWPGAHDAPAVLVRVPVRPSIASVRSAAVLAGSDGQMIGGVLLDAAGKTVEAWRGFGAQLAGKDLPSLERAVPRDALRTTLRRLAAGAAAPDANPEARAAQALAALRTDMLRLSQAAPEVMAALEQTQPVPAEALEATAAALASMRARATDLEPLLGEATAAYQERIGVATEAVDAIRQWRPDGDVAGKVVLRQLRRSCSACHQLEHAALPAELATFVGDKLVAVGLGDRPFEPGHDLLIGDLDEASARPLAAALQRAALAASTILAAPR